jgi:hypothetical protein
MPGTPGGVVFKLFQISMPRGVSTRYTTNMLMQNRNNLSDEIFCLAIVSTSNLSDDATVEPRYSRS